MKFRLDNELAGGYNIGSTHQGLSQPLVYWDPIATVMWVPFFCMG